MSKINNMLAMIDELEKGIYAETVQVMRVLVEEGRAKVHLVFFTDGLTGEVRHELSYSAIPPCSAEDDWGATLIAAEDQAHVTTESK